MLNIFYLSFLLPFSLFCVFFVSFVVLFSVWIYRMRVSVVCSIFGKEKTLNKNKIETEINQRNNNVKEKYADDCCMSKSIQLKKIAVQKPIYVQAEKQGR